MHPRARAQRLEVVIGILGFFDVVALVNAVAALARGRPLLGPVIVLVGITALLAAAVRLRERMSP